MDPPPAITQKTDCVVVNLELQVVIAGNAAAAAGGHGSDDSYQVVDVKARPTAGVVQPDHHVVVDVDRLAIDVITAAGTTTRPKGHAAVEVVKPKGGVDDGAAGKNRCVGCGKPMRWVTIGGRCGHRGVCSKCMVRDRFFKQNKRCCICKIQCPKVLVAKADDGVRGGAATPPKLPRFAFRDGRVGNYWYHRHTAAYFEEEKEYQAVRTECEGIIPPFYHPLGLFIIWFTVMVVPGSLMAFVFASRMKNLASQVGFGALSIFVALLFATFIWTLGTCAKDEPAELEARRYYRDNNEQSICC